MDFYPPFFKQKYAEIWGSEKMNQYNPAIMPQNRGSSAWVYWQDCPPEIAWCLKQSPEVATRVPYFAPMFLDLLNQGLMRNLQTNINMSVANRILVAEIPQIKDAQIKTRDQFSISEKNLAGFMAFVKAALGDSIKGLSFPMQNAQALAFPSENDMYKSYLATTVASSGIAADIIFSGETRPNILATQASINVDEQMMYSLYPQFEAFLNYNISKLTKNFKFKFKFEGSKFMNNREFRLNQAKDLASLGIVLPQKFAAAIGMSPFEFDRQLLEAKENDFVDNLTPIAMASQMSNPGAGRPQKNDGDLSDSGADTRANGGNIEKGVS
jgi:hypothetical protein